jgi:hypothetical protein
MIASVQIASRSGAAPTRHQAIARGTSLSGPGYGVRTQGPHAMQDQIELSEREKAERPEADRDREDGTRELIPGTALPCRAR